MVALFLVLVVIAAQIRLLNCASMVEERADVWPKQQRGVGRAPSRLQHSPLANLPGTTQIKLPSQNHNILYHRWEGNWANKKREKNNTQLRDDSVIWWCALVCCQSITVHERDQLHPLNNNKSYHTQVEHELVKLSHGLIIHRFFYIILLLCTCLPSCINMPIIQRAIKSKHTTSQQHLS